MKNLADVWAYLYATEQQKIVSILTDTVVVGDEGIKISLNLQGFDRVMVELVWQSGKTMYIEKTL